MIFVGRGQKLSFEYIKKSIKSPLELISKFSNVTGYKINIQKSIVTLSITSESSKTNIPVYNEIKNSKITSN